MMRTKIVNKMTVLVVAVVVLFGVVFSATPNLAYAQETGNAFDKTNVLDDLQSSTIDGQPFDITDYPYDESKDIQVINFVEYCYSFRANKRDNYGLYVYLYNPKGLNLSTNSKSNKIQVAVSYDENGNAKDYAKLSLEYCSKSEGSQYKNLFYKYKIVDSKINGTIFADRVNSLERRYDISGIEILTYGNSNAIDYHVGGTYIFTGYAEGCGPDESAKSTLACTVKFLETVSLDVKHTFYRTKTSVKGAGYQNQLDTVYFAVPQRFFDLYGKLQRVKAEWYEYKTKDIVVTSNQTFYDKAYPWIGRQTGDFDQFGMTVYNKNIGISLGQNAGDAGGVMNLAKWGWNLGSGYLHVPAPALYYLFKTDNISAYDPYADIVENGGVASNALYEYILNYNKTYDKGTLPIKDGTISADLFTDDIDDYRKMDTEYGKIQKGYSYYDFDADVDLQKLSSWNEGNPSFWDNWINWGLWDAMFGKVPQEESRTIPPIYTLKASDLVGSDNDIAERLLINAADVKELRNYYNDAVTVNGKDDEKKMVVLFRFATSDYYSAEVDIMELGKGFLGSDKYTRGQSYRAWESVYFDFDIIQLTFYKDGNYKIIPVVSSPIDIVNGITSPVQFGEPDWWKIIVGILLLILLVIVLWPIMPYIVKAIIWVLLLPVKAVKSLINSVKKRKENKEKSKE